MKALTICQPYAHLIVTGKKRVENRGWSTRHRGLLLIHAGKSKEWLCGDVPSPDMAFGAVVGAAQLLDCLHIDEIRQGTHEARYPWLSAHLHTEGPWCWLLDDVRRFDPPMSCKGAQGLWTVPDHLVPRRATSSRDQENADG